MSWSTVEAVGRQRLSDAGVRRLAGGDAVRLVGSTVTGLLLDRGWPARHDALFGVGLLTFPVVGFLVVAPAPPDTPLGWVMVSMGTPRDPSRLTAYGALAPGQRGLRSGRWRWRWVARVGAVHRELRATYSCCSPTVIFRHGGGAGSPGHAASGWRSHAGDLCYPGDFADSGFPQVQNPIGIDGFASFFDT